MLITRNISVYEKALALTRAFDELGSRIVTIDQLEAIGFGLVELYKAEHDGIVGIGYDVDEAGAQLRPSVAVLIQKAVSPASGKIINESIFEAIDSLIYLPDELAPRNDDEREDDNFPF